MKRLSFQVSRRWRRWDLLVAVTICSIINWTGDNILWTRPGGGAEQGALHPEHNRRKWRLETEDRGLADGQVAAHCWGWPVWGAHQSGGHSSNSDSFLFFTFSSTVESSGVSVRVMCEGPPVSGEHRAYSFLPLIFFAFDGVICHLVFSTWQMFRLWENVASPWHSCPSSFITRWIIVSRTSMLIKSPCVLECSDM